MIGRNPRALRLALGLGKDRPGPRLGTWISAPYRLRLPPLHHVSILDADTIRSNHPTGSASSAQ